MKKMSLSELKLTANTLRQDVISMLAKAGSGHPGGSLGMADVFAALYFHILKNDPKDPEWQERDRLVLSNGHICPIWYATLARAGYFPVEELDTLRQINSRLQGHPHNHSLPGLENSSGPLGQGLSIAVGHALAARLDKAKHRVYCVMSDGEHDEGQTWEATMFAANHKLSNITSLIDRNNIQIDSFTEDVMPLEPFKEKLRSFKWHVIEIDGHNIRQVVDACNQAKAIYEKPTAIICHTIPGKGVGFMEFEFDWHGVAPDAEQAEAALKELREEREKISSSDL